jgi:hypothetical protein
MLKFHGDEFNWGMLQSDQREKEDEERKTIQEQKPNKHNKNNRFLQNIFCKHLIRRNITRTIGFCKKVCKDLMIQNQHGESPRIFRISRETGYKVDCPGVMCAEFHELCVTCSDDAPIIESGVGEIIAYVC